VIDDGIGATNVAEGLHQAVRPSDRFDWGW